MRNGAALEERQRWMRERGAPGPVEVPSAAAGLFEEKHYAPAELAARWSLGPDVVRKLFLDEPGVVVLGGAEKGKRQYRTIRIPASVAERVHRRLRNR